MVALEFSWDQVADPAFGTQPPLAWRDAVAQVAAKAKEKLPESNGRTEKAVALVLAGAVTIHADGSATVTSQTDPTQTYHVSSGVCPCPDYARAPHNFCKHRLVSAIARRAQELVAGTPASPSPAPDASAVSPGIPPQYIVVIQGKNFVTFAGLLALAHTRGLISLTADWTYNDAGLSLAKAVAVFPFGTFTECGDATPDNVTKRVSPHFRRVALTRAKARCLRDALNIDMVSFEELAE